MYTLLCNTLATTKICSSKLTPRPTLSPLRLLSKSLMAVAATLVAYLTVSILSCLTSLITLTSTSSKCHSSRTASVPVEWEWSILEWLIKPTCLRLMRILDRYGAIGLVSPLLVLNLNCSVFWVELGELSLMSARVRILILTLRSNTSRKRRKSWSWCKLIWGGERSEARASPPLLNSLWIMRRVGISDGLF